MNQFLKLTWDNHLALRPSLSLLHFGPSPNTFSEAFSTQEIAQPGHLQQNELLN